MGSPSAILCMKIEYRVKIGNRYGKVQFFFLHVFCKTFNEIKFDPS